MIQRWIFHEPLWTPLFSFHWFYLELIASWSYTPWNHIWDIQHIHMYTTMNLYVAAHIHVELHILCLRHSNSSHAPAIIVLWYCKNLLEKLPNMSLLGPFSTNLGYLSYYYCYPKTRTLLLLSLLLPLNRSKYFASNPFKLFLFPICMLCIVKLLQLSKVIIIITTWLVSRPK